MKAIEGYRLITPAELAWRPSNMMRIPNADFLERTGSEILGARLWRLPPKSANTLHKHVRAEEFYFVVEDVGRIIGDQDRPTVRLPGSGGANDIASLCNKLLIVTSHESRRFVEKVDFVTSPGWLAGGTSRCDAGLRRGGPTAVVTELAVFDFHPVSKEMRLCALQAGVSVDEVRSRTGFELTTVEGIGHVAPPTDVELQTLRKLTGVDVPQ